jgi:hypothetical protein
MSKKSTEVKISKESIGINAQFDVLRFRFGRANNVVAFKESAYLFTSKYIGASSLVIKEETRFIRDDVQTPPNINGVDAFAAVNDPHGFTKHRHIREVTERQKILTGLASEERRLFSHLWGNCSKESQEQIARAPIQVINADGSLAFVNLLGAPCAQNDPNARPLLEVWNSIFNRGDVLSLMKIINRTHLATDSGVSSINRLQVVQRHETIKMTAIESLLEYKHRFDSSIEAFSTVQESVPDDSRQASRFISTLDDGRYGTFKADLHNWARSGMTQYPAFLQEAYERAST